MKLLCIVLTSHDAEYAVRAYCSVLRQQSHTWDVDTHILVNSTLPHYLQDVQAAFDSYNYHPIIVDTPSNGKPGKGHNAALSYFEQHAEYSHMFLIDGDDMLYPCCFQQLQSVWNPTMDVLHTCTNDDVTCDPARKQFLHWDLRPPFFLTGPPINNHSNPFANKSYVNPFETSIWKCTTPSRILMVSRNIFSGSSRIVYSETLQVYDDYIAFLHMISMPHINSVAVANNCLYCYNSLSDGVTKQAWTNDQMTYEQTQFDLESQPFLRYKTEWFETLERLQWMNIAPCPTFQQQERLQFCDKEMVQFDIEYKQRQATRYFNGYQFQRVVELCEILYFRYQLNVISPIWIQSYIKMGLYERALYFLLCIAPHEMTPLLAKTTIVLLWKLGWVYVASKYCSLYHTRWTSDSDLELLRHRLPRIELPKPIANQRPNVVLYTGYHSGCFNGDTYKQSNGVYGSEIAAINLARQYARNNYNVHVIGNCQPGICDTITFYHWESPDAHALFTIREIDILIISRFLNFFLHFPHRAKKTILWIHDRRAHESVATGTFPNLGRSLLYNSLPRIDSIVLQTRWHKQAFIQEDAIPLLDQSKIVVIGNGCDESLFDESLSQAPQEWSQRSNRILYASDPSRGLATALDCLQELQKQTPDFAMEICFECIQSPELQQRIQSIPNVTFHKRLEQQQLCRLMETCRYLVYPVQHHETFCIVALECMRAGCIPITTNETGIGELIAPLRIGIPGDRTQPEWIQRAVHLINECQTKLQGGNEKSRECIRYAKQLSWEHRFKEWGKL